MLPEIFVSGEEYTRKIWEEKRRSEILELFEAHVYGATPKDKPDRVEAHVEMAEMLDQGTVKREVISIKIVKNGKTCKFTCRFYSPVQQIKALGTVIMINPFSANRELDYPGKAMDHMPYDLITSNGLVGIHADVDELCPDDSVHYQEGLWELYEQEGKQTWGAIGMWAFAVSRLIDYLQSRDDVDCRKIAVCGCSRAGKAALWCAAQDPRIALVISNVSGCTGAAITRGKTGEHIRDITAQFPHWMCPVYTSYAEQEDLLPVDQHMLLALCAPRPLYVSSASEDVWADPKKEFESEKMAEKVYGLYGRTGLGLSEFPPIDVPVSGEYAAYHNRKGVHGCRRYDWQQYLPFINRFFAEEKSDLI